MKKTRGFLGTAFAIMAACLLVLGLGLSGFDLAFGAGGDGSDDTGAVLVVESSNDSEVAEVSATVEYGITISFSLPDDMDEVPYGVDVADWLTQHGIFTVTETSENGKETTTTYTADDEKAFKTFMAYFSDEAETPIVFDGESYPTAGETIEDLAWAGLADTYEGEVGFEDFEVSMTSIDSASGDGVENDLLPSLPEDAAAAITLTDADGDDAPNEFAIDDDGWVDGLWLSADGDGKAVPVTLTYKTSSKDVASVFSASGDLEADGTFSDSDAANTYTASAAGTIYVKLWDDFEARDSTGETVTLYEGQIVRLPVSVDDTEPVLESVRFLEAGTDDSDDDLETQTVEAEGTSILLGVDGEIYVQIVDPETDDDGNEIEASGLQVNDENEPEITVSASYALGLDEDAETTKLNLNATVDDDGWATISLDDGLYHLDDIIVTAVDNAGNEYEISLKDYLDDSTSIDAILVDASAPSASNVSIELSGTGASDAHTEAGYYQSSVTVTITVNDPLLGIYQDIYKEESKSLVTVVYGDEEVALTFEQASGSSTSWNATYTTPVVDDDPLESTYTVKVIDYTNYDDSSDALATKSFTIDATAPVVSELALSKQHAKSWGWIFSQSEQTVSVTIEDEGSGVDAETAVIYVSEDGEDAYDEESASAISDATELSNDDGAFSCALSEDGDSLTFEGTYVVVSDLAGNETVVELSELLPGEGEEAEDGSLLTSGSVGTAVDLYDPVVEIALTTTDGSDAEGTTYDLDDDGTNEIYYDESLTLTVTITEANFNLIVENAEDETYKIGTITCDDDEDMLYAEDFSQDETSGDWTATYTLDSDGDWEVALSFTDAAGRSSNTIDEAFTIDTTAPVIIVEFDNNDVENEKYYDAGRTATITVTERYFDPDLATVQVNGEAQEWVELEDEDDADGEAESGADDAYAHSIEISFDEEGVYILTVDCSDPAGNEAEGYSAEFVIDMTAPTFDELELSETSPYTWDWVFARDEQTFTFTVSDNLAGIDVDTAWAYLSNGTDEELTSELEDGATEGAMSFSLTEDGDRIRFASSKVTVSDLAGNTTTINLSPSDDDEVTDGLVANGVENNLPDEDAVGTAVDDYAPVITATYDYNDVVNGSFYNQNRTITIVIEEANFDFIVENDPYRDIAVLTRDGTEITLQAEDFENPSGDGLTWIATYSFETDGDWTVSISLTDVAGRASNVFEDAFTIDTTDPYIMVTFDNDDSENLMYYKATRTATIEISERNFDSSLVTISTTASNGSAPSPSGWTETEEDVWTCTVYFGDETHYTLDVSCTDLASNTAEPYSEGEFVIDMTMPELEIGGVEDLTAYADEVMPTITCSDINFDSLSTYYELTGSNQGSVYSYATETEREDGMDVAFADFEHELDMDDVYTLYVCAVDLAGNTTEGEVTFSVNRFGSNYILVGDSTGINGSYLSEAQDVQVREINVSGLDTSASHVELVQDSRVSTLSLDEDYTTEEGTTNGSWSDTLYTFPAELFDDDGYYRILLTSEDVAGNLSQNTMDYKNETRDDTAEIAFAVDTTAPSAELITIDAGGVYLDPLMEVDADVHDNLEVESASVTVDGEEVVSWDATDLEAALCSFELAADGESHDIVITSTDRAGNKTVASYDDVTIVDNIFEYILNTPEILYGLVAGGIAAAAITALAVFLYLRHRRATEFERNPFGRS